MSDKNTESIELTPEVFASIARMISDFATMPELSKKQTINNWRQYIASYLDSYIKVNHATSLNNVVASPIPVSVIPYQKCPVCKGKGRVQIGSTHQDPYTDCLVCKGQRIIPMYQIKS